MFDQLKSAICACTLGAALTLGAPVFAQEAAEDVSLAQVVEDIAASRNATLERIDTLSGQIDLATIELEQADQAFNEMIETLRAHAAVGDPDGSYVTRLQALEEAAKADADAAKTAGYLDFEEAFLEDADIFAEQRGTLVSEFEALERRIRAVEAERERIVFLIKLRRYDEIQTLFTEATGIIREGTERVADVENALRASDPSLVEN